MEAGDIFWCFLSKFPTSQQPDAKPEKATFLWGRGSAAQISNFTAANDAKPEKATFLRGSGSYDQICNSTTGALVLLCCCFQLLVLKFYWEWAYLVVYYWVLVCGVSAFSILYDCFFVWSEVGTGVGFVGVVLYAGSFVGYFVCLLVGLVVVLQVALLID